MIEPFEYSIAEIELLYSIIEKAVQNKDGINVSIVSDFIRSGDFCCVGSAANGLLFEFRGLKWIVDGKIYRCRFQPHVIHGNPFPVWYPVISTEEQSGTSSGDISMFTKENRYYSFNMEYNRK